MTQFEHPEEAEFIRATQCLLKGTDPRPLAGKRLQLKEKGLWRDAKDQSPFIQALQDAVAKAVLSYLARRGGTTPSTYAIHDKVKKGALLQIPDAVPLKFTSAVPTLLLHLLDDAKGPTGIPGTLGDRLVFHLICRAVPNESLAALSPITRLSTLTSFTPEFLKDFPTQLVIRSMASVFYQSWSKKILAMVEAGDTVASLGQTLVDYTKFCKSHGVFSLMPMIGVAYHRLLRDHINPEDLLRKAAEATKKHRKVSDQEALLRSWGSVFSPAITLLEELDRIVQLSHVERNAEERILREELVGIRAYLEMGRGLATALTQTIK